MKKLLYLIVLFPFLLWADGSEVESDFVVDDGDLTVRNGDIVISSDSKKLLLGTGNDASITYDGSNMIFNSQEVGSGEYMFNDADLNTTDIFPDINGRLIGTPSLRYDPYFGTANIGTLLNIVNAYIFGNLVPFTDDTYDVGASIRQYSNVYSVDGTFSGNVGIGDSTPDTTLEVNGAITINELSSDPGLPAEGKAVIWMSDGTDTGSDGDLLYQEQSGAAISTGSLKWTDFVPSAATVNAGTVTGGSVISDAQTMFDGNDLTLDEVAATPGYDIEFEFGNIDRYPTFVVARWKYNGSSTHFVTIDIYNYNTTSWDQVRYFKDTDAYYSSMTMYIPQTNQDDYVDGSGNAIVRFYHQSAGNASHDVTIDYVGLTHGLQGVK